MKNLLILVSSVISCLLLACCAERAAGWFDPLRVTSPAVDSDSQGLVLSADPCNWPCYMPDTAGTLQLLVSCATTAVFSLGPLLYRRALASKGGPVARLELSSFPVFEHPMVQANAYLVPGLVPERPDSMIYGLAHGSGTASEPMLARFKAISESLERWAYHAKWMAPDRELFGFELDPTSNGMAAFPGLTRSRARRCALLEAVERASLFAWWEGITDGERCSTRWDGVSAVAIPSPVGFGLTVVAYRRIRPGCYAYGHAAGTTFDQACDRAVIEVARHQAAIRRHREHAALGMDVRPPSLHISARRCLYFSSEAGFARFEERVVRPPKGRRFSSSVVWDTEVVGPWSKYATVWRVLIAPPSREYLSDSEQYFFW